jgi:Signal transduction histidine kinase
MRKTIPLLLNSVLFICGVSLLFLQHTVLCAVCYLLISILFIWTFKTEHTSIDLPSEENLSEDTEAQYAKLSLQVEELTAANELFAKENKQLMDELNLSKNAQTNTRYNGVLYTCPLTSSLPMCLDNFFTDYLNHHADFIKRQKITLNYSCSSPEAVTYLSSAALTLICGNIIDNMIKFSPLSESAYIRITAYEGGSLIIFKNEGNGPAESELDKLFDLNYQGINKKGGLGLGLSQVKVLIDDYGGEVWAKSTKNTGFTLYIKLPEQPVTTADEKISLINWEK